MTDQPGPSVERLRAEIEDLSDQWQVEADLCEEACCSQILRAKADELAALLPAPGEMTKDEEELTRVDGVPK